MSDTLKTLLLGAAGLAVTIGLSIATLHLTHEEVGLTAEPINAGLELAAPTSGVTGATAATGEKPAKRRERSSGDDASNKTTGGDSQGQADSGGDSTSGNSHGGDDSGDDSGDNDGGGDDSANDGSGGDDDDAEGGEDHDDDD